MTTQHTPGPWTKRLAHSVSEAQLQGEYSRAIELISELRTQRVELLAALRRVVAELDGTPGDSLEKVFSPNCCAQIRAAIAKAEGVQS